MFDIIKKIIELFTDKSKSFGKRFLMFFGVIMFLFFIDFTFKVTYNFSVNNKLDQLEKIKNLQKEYVNDTLKLKELSRLEFEIFNNEHYFDFISRNILYNPTIIEYINSTKSNNKKENQKAITNDSINNIRQYLPMFASSNLLILILIPVLLIVPFFDNSEQEKYLLFLGVLTVIVLLIIFGIVTTWVAYRIPVIYGNSTYNYILNFLIQCLFWFLIIKIGNKTNANNV